MKQGKSTPKSCISNKHSSTFYTSHERSQIQKLLEHTPTYSQRPNTKPNNFGRYSLADISKLIDTKGDLVLSHRENNEKFSIQASKLPHQVSVTEVSNWLYPLTANEEMAHNQRRPANSIAAKEGPKHKGVIRLRIEEVRNWELNSEGDTLNDYDEDDTDIKNEIISGNHLLFQPENADFCPKFDGGKSESGLSHSDTDHHFYSRRSQHQENYVDDIVQNISRNSPLINQGILCDHSLAKDSVHENDSCRLSFQNETDKFSTKKVAYKKPNSVHFPNSPRQISKAQGEDTSGKAEDMEAFGTFLLGVELIRLRRIMDN